VSVYTLRTVNVLRKYSSFLDIPMSFLLGNVVYVAGPKHWTLLCAAMGRHASQFVWFRKLYMVFSR
jgi:N-acetylglucosaminylphosphatidylinositol deacetylase